MPKRPRSVCDMPWSQNIIHILPQIIYRYALGSTLLELKWGNQGSRLQWPGNRWWLARAQYLFTYQIWICYHKQYRRSAVGAFFHNLASWLLRSRSQWLKTVSDIPWHVIWDMLLTLCFACCRWVFLSVNCFVPIHTTVMLTVCYINRQPGRGYHFSKTNACGKSAASKNDHCTN